MIRVFVFIALLLVGSIGLSYLADTPGSVSLAVGETTYRVSLMTGMAILAGIVLSAMFLWTLVRLVFRLPGIVALSNRLRRRTKGFTAASRGLIAVGVGDARAATRLAAEAGRLLGHDPLALLVRAQAAQLTGDRPGAESAFKAMLGSEETRILGLRGLHIEAQRRQAHEEARRFADEAYRLAPGARWAGEALLAYRAGDADWRGALAIVEQNASRRLVERGEARRQRAVLLTAEALEHAARNPDEALALALDAHRLAPDLVPAAVLAGRRLSAKGEFAKAAKIIEASWKLHPHPDLADAYMAVRPGDSTLDRLKRTRALQRLAPRDRESGLAVARAALDARDFDAAREALEALVLERPTTRACLLMAELEEQASGNMGLVRAWLARASRGVRDPAWVADGVVSDHWAAVSPVSGRLDAFRWETPPQAFEAHLRAAIDADVVEPPPLMPALPAAPEHGARSAEPVLATVAMRDLDGAVAGPVASASRAPPPPDDPGPRVG